LVFFLQNLFEVFLQIGETITQGEALTATLRIDLKETTLQTGETIAQEETLTIILKKDLKEILEKKDQEKILEKVDMAFQERIHPIENFQIEKDIMMTDQ
jgi:NAD+--asparagine ADP-ribosyltransferase